MIARLNLERKQSRAREQALLALRHENSMDLTRAKARAILVNNVTQRITWMPRLRTSMKDVASCDMLR